MRPFGQQSMSASVKKSDVKRLRTVNLEFHLGKSQDETEGAREDREKVTEFWRKWIKLSLFHTPQDQPYLEGHQL